MGRLTDKESYCSFVECDFESKFGIERRDNYCRLGTTCFDKKMYDKLKEYEDLEEQGLLLKLPCKRVWRIALPKTKYAYVLGNAIDNLTISEIRGIDKYGYYYSTAEKAEKALAEMEKKNEESN